MSTLMDTMPAYDQTKAIDFIIEANPEGEVTATVPVSWIFDDKTLEYIANNRNSSPQLLIVVASYRTVPQVGHDYSAADKARKAGGDIDDEQYQSLVVELDESYTSYSVTSVQQVPLLNRKGLPMPAKTHVKFDRPGNNIVIGRIINMYGAHDRDTVYGWTRREDLSVRQSTSEQPLTLNAYYDGEEIMERGHGLSSVNVVVPAEMFAKERPAWQKFLVRKFFRNREEDECHFRKHLWFGAIPATVAVQFYGLFVRLATLLFALVTARRKTFSKMFFAFNPHDYGRYLGKSWWTKDNEGNDRSNLRQILSPQGLITIAAVFFVAMIPGLLITSIWRWVTNGESPASFSTILVVSLIADAIIAFIVFACWLMFKYEGREWFREYVAWPINDLVEKLTPKREQPSKNVVAKSSAERDDDVLTLLRRAQASIAAGDKVESTTFILRFNDFKMKVCRQFAKP